MHRRRICAVLAALFVAIVAMSSAASAQAESERGLPSDPNARGYIGLCNENGQNVTGGSINARPFIWKAVSSSHPPGSFQGHGQNADLLMFQPRPDTGPAYWSGTAMTAAAYYVSKEVPAVQANLCGPVASRHDQPVPTQG